MRKGFTIVELLIVIVVIGILAAITIVAYSGIQNRAKISAVQGSLAQAVKSIESYKTTDVSELYPATTAAANINNSNGTTYTYYPNTTARSYCLSATNGGVTYSVTSLSPSPKVGDCTTQSLVGWWTFNGNATDQSGNGNNGTALGTPTLTTGQDGSANSAYSFGTGNAFNMGNSAVFSTPELTYSAWVYPTTLSGSQSIMAKESQYKYRLGGTFGSLLVSRNGSAWGPVVSYGSVPTANTWYHMVLVVSSNANTYTGYINGVAAAPGSLGGAITSYNTNPLYIGTYSAAVSEPFNGTIDDARIYNRALSPAEVQALYTGGAQ